MSFDQLTERQKLHRLRRVAIAALRRYDVEVDRLRLLHHDFNTSYRVDAADGSTFVLRISSTDGCHDLDETAAEVAWIAELSRRTSLIVPRPRPMRDGAVVGVVDQDVTPNHRQHVLFEWIDGQTLGDRIGRRTAADLGACMARMHEAAKGFQLPAGCRVRRFDRVFPYSAEGFRDVEPILVHAPEFASLFTARMERVYRDAQALAQQEIDALWNDASSLHLIHNDLHPWNTLVSRGQVAVIDFEDVILGHAAQDLGTTLYYLRCRDDAVQVEAALRAGYETIAAWPFRDERQCAAMIAVRGLILLNTVMVSSDAALRAKAGHYVELIGERLDRWIVS